MGLFNLSLYAGLSLGPVAGGVVKDVLGIRAAFLGMGRVCLLGFFLCRFFRPPRTAEQHVDKRRPAGYRSIIKHRSVGALFLFRAAFTTCIGIVWAFLPLLAETQFHLSSSAVGFLVMLGVLMSGLLQTPMGLLADRISKRALIVTGGLVTAASIFSFNYANDFWGLFAANTLFGIGGGISIPAVMAMTVIIGRRTKAMGSIMALLTMGHSLGMLIGPILAGFMIDAFQLRYAFFAGTVIITLGTITAVALTSGFQAWTLQDTDGEKDLKAVAPAQLTTNVP